MYLARKSRPTFFHTFAVPRPASFGHEPPALVSQLEAAHRLGVSRTTIWRLIKARRLQPVRIGSRTLITSRSLDNFINDQIAKGRDE